MKYKNLSSDKKRKVGFIILHYNNFNITKECIESILNLNEQDRIKILVVDNHSPDRSGEKLSNVYLNNEQVDVLLLKNNYGFSKANNIAYNCLTEDKEYEFIVVSNNDIIFTQKNFISLLEQAYNDREFYVGGPDIYAVYKKEHQSPLALAPRTEEEIKVWISENQKKLRYVRVESILRKIWLKVNETRLYHLYCKMKKEVLKDERNWKEHQDNIVLSGACLFFSEKFIGLNIKPFEPETNFYHEEDILTAKCLRNRWKISYIPEIQIKHLEGISTNEKKYYDKMKFRYTNFIDSGRIYLDYISKGKENGE